MRRKNLFLFLCKLKYLLKKLNLLFFTIELTLIKL
jgi:hypothetical protein